MRDAPIAVDDERRLASLWDYEISGTPAEATFDAIAGLVAALCDIPVALVTFVGESDLWVKSCIGEFVYRPDRTTSFCGHAIAGSGEVFVVEDARADLRFYDNPLVCSDPHLRFYAAAPLVPSDGFALGALCIIDFVPRISRESDRLALVLGARAICAILDERRATHRFERSLGEHRALAFAACHDALTRLPNRAYFMQRLEARLQQLDTRERAPFAVMFLDVDGFKDVNDTHGHVCGDGVLVTIARRLAKIVRGSDVVARMGGDEFTILVDSASDVASIARLADRIVRAIAAPIREGDIELSITISIGIVIATDAGVRVEDLIAEADAAMFAAKALGRNRFEFSHGDLRVRSPSRDTKRS